MAKPDYIVWHVSASRFGTPSLIRSWHLARGWSDIGYHGVVLNGYLTAEDWTQKRRVSWLNGSFQLGRTWNGDGFIEGDEVGAHAYGLNSESLGLCLIGDVDKQYRAELEPEQFRTGIQVTRRWMDQFCVDVEGVIGHREIGRFKPEYATDKACPGFDMQIVREAIAGGDRGVDRFLERLFIDREQLRKR